MNIITTFIQTLTLRTMGSRLTGLRPLWLLSACALLMSGCYSSSSVPEPVRADGLQDPGLHAIMTLRSTLPLSADAANIYAERATELKGFAGELEALARAGRINELRPIVAQVNASCNSCHQLFRAP